MVHIIMHMESTCNTVNYTNIQHNLEFNGHSAKYNKTTNITIQKSLGKDSEQDSNLIMKILRSNMDYFLEKNLLLFQTSLNLLSHF